MCVIASWKMDGLFKADANLVHKEIESIGQEFTCEQIVEKAKDSNTELHKCFEWNNEVAAEKYRLHQAGQIVRQLVITKVSDEKEPEKSNVRLFVSTGNRTNAYKPLQSVVRVQSEYEALLNRAYAELQTFKQKYSSLSELEDILALIE